MKHAALMHDAEDDVAVVIRDIEAGQEVLALTQDGGEAARISAAGAIPLGHKIAVRQIKKGQSIRKYGRSIGRASRNIEQGALVHTQNLKSERWG